MFHIFEKESKLLVFASVLPNKVKKERGGVMDRKWNGKTILMMLLIAVVFGWLGMVLADLALSPVLRHQPTLSEPAPSSGVTMETAPADLPAPASAELEMHSFAITWSQ